MTQGCFGVLKIATGLKGQDSYSTMNIRGDLNSFWQFFSCFKTTRYGFKTTRYDSWFLQAHWFLFIVISNFYRTLYFSHTEFSPDFFPIKNMPKNNFYKRHRECWELERHLDSDRSHVVRIDTNLWKDSLFPSDKNYDAHMKKDTPGKNERQTNPKVMEVRFRFRLFFFSIGWFWGSMLL